MNERIKRSGRGAETHAVHLEEEEGGDAYLRKGGNRLRRRYQRAGERKVRRIATAEVYQNTWTKDCLLERAA